MASNSRNNCGYLRQKPSFDPLELLKHILQLWARILWGRDQQTFLKVKRKRADSEYVQCGGTWSLAATHLCCGGMKAAQIIQGKWAVPIKLYLQSRHQAGLGPRAVVANPLSSEKPGAQY